MCSDGKSEALFTGFEPTVPTLAEATDADSCFYMKTSA